MSSYQPQGSIGKAVLAATLVLSSSALLAQKQFSLTIVSPVSGTIVKPGETINVVVSAGGPNKQGNEFVFGAGPDGPEALSTEQSIGPVRIFQLTIPKDARHGPLVVTAAQS